MYALRNRKGNPDVSRNGIDTPLQFFSRVLVVATITLGGLAFRIPEHRTILVVSLIAVIAALVLTVAVLAVARP